MSGKAQVTGPPALILPRADHLRQRRDHFRDLAKMVQHLSATGLAGFPGALQGYPEILPTGASEDALKLTRAPMLYALVQVASLLELNIATTYAAATVAVHPGNNQQTGIHVMG